LIDDQPYDREDLPPWFSNEEDSGGTIHQQHRWRVVFGLGIVSVVLVMLLIPVLQAEILQRHRDSLPDKELDRTALLFASAMLFGQSEGQAMILSKDTARTDVRATLRKLIERPQPSNRARLQISSVPCNEKDAEGCFQGRIVDPAHPSLTVIRFGIDKTREGPRISWVEIDEITAMGRLNIAGRIPDTSISTFDCRTARCTDRL
jgi:hypothetical protein